MALSSRQQFLSTSRLQLDDGDAYLVGNILPLLISICCLSCLSALVDCTAACKQENKRKLCDFQRSNLEPPEAAAQSYDQRP